MISALVLAAGTSSRLGRPKQLLDLGGKPVLQHVVDAAVAARVDEVIVVLGHAASDVATVLRPDELVRVVLNEQYARGQSTSVWAGLAAVGPDTEAVVILLGDQPYVRTDALRAVIREWRNGGGEVVQAAYGGRPAHPILFGRTVWADLRAATGDEGARGMLARHPEWLRLVEVGGSPPEDIDTEEDYIRLSRNESRR